VKINNFISEFLPRMPTSQRLVKCLQWIPLLRIPFIALGLVSLEQLSWDAERYLIIEMCVSILLDLSFVLMMYSFHEHEPSWRKSKRIVYATGFVGMCFMFSIFVAIAVHMDQHIEQRESNAAVYLYFGDSFPFIAGYLFALAFMGLPFYLRSVEHQIEPLYPSAEL
jgi:hypothetical protein